jgi:microcin C transport system permease protein
VAAGAVQGYFGGKVDLIFQRVIEIWQGMPVLYLLIIMSSIIAPSFFTLLFIMLLFSWMHLVGVVRAEVLKVRNLDYVRAARALGVSTMQILWRHVLPNALTTALTLLPFALTAHLVVPISSSHRKKLGMPRGILST